mmetsp:Transcript_4753/g.9346  ORF Transcript_4753/g.9346 Transcript_4753/m.9346 type:complete len:226 (-) Transcript_4753:85-762(-)
MAVRRNVALLAMVTRLATGVRVRNTAHSLPFDCYLNKGADYVGLKTSSSSGRRCMNWLNSKDAKDLVSVKGIGNHNYCRNPKGGKDKPWCFTVDPKVGWEYCEVPECPADGKPPEPWVSPKGAKSVEAEAKGPCKYEKPDVLAFKEYKSGRACMDNRGDTWWLISNKRIRARSPKDCQRKCAELPGTEYFTFFAKTRRENCGCYRECVLQDEKLTVNSPTVYRVK